MGRKIEYTFTDGYGMRVGVRSDGIIMWACDCKEMCGGKRRWRKSEQSTLEMRGRYGLEILRLSKRNKQLERIKTIYDELIKND